MVDYKLNFEKGVKPTAIIIHIPLGKIMGMDIYVNLDDGFLR